MTKEDIWESFFNDPLLARILEEAGAEMVDSDDDPTIDGSQDGEEPSEDDGGQGSDMNLEQLAADFQEGNLDQEDLIKLYQSGKISKEEIQQIVAQVEGEEPQDEEELMNQQIDQTNDMFVKFALYDKIIELTEKLDYFKENFDNTRSDIYERVLQLGEFLNILSSLIFSIETSVSYQMYGSILLQLTELFNEYNQVQKVENAQENVEDEQEDAEHKSKIEDQINNDTKEIDNPERAEGKSSQDVSVNDLKSYTV